MAAAASSTASASQSVRLAKRALRKAVGARLAGVSKEDILAQSATITRTLLGSQLYQDARTVSVYLNTPSGEVDTHELCLDALRNHKTLYVPSFALASPSLPSSKPAPSAKPQFAAEMSMLRITDEDDYLSLPSNSYGIREPSPDDRIPPLPHSSSSSSTADLVPRTEALAPHDQGGTGLDLILCPGLAFDLHAGRLGHGKGYYDRYLLRAKEWALREQARRKQQEEGGGDVRLPVVLALSLRQQVLRGDGEQGGGGRVPMDERDVQLDAILTPDELILPSLTQQQQEEEAREDRPPNDRKIDPIPGGSEHVRALAEAGTAQVHGAGGEEEVWRGWGFAKAGAGSEGLKILRGGVEI
ncbi:hypothetical protein V8E36_008935 [Tilletia maclaganii]